MCADTNDSHLAHLAQIHKLEQEIKNLKLALLETEKKSGTICASAAFSAILYSRSPHWYEDALEFGTTAAANGQLDLSRNYHGFEACLGLTCHGESTWSDFATQRRLVTGLFELILQNGGRARLSVIGNLGVNPLIDALIHRSFIVAELLAQEPETDINHITPKRKQTALMLAASAGCVKVCELLLNRITEIDLDIADADGKTAEQYIGKSSQIAIKKLFTIAKSRISEYQRSAPIIISSTLNAVLLPDLLKIIFQFLRLTR